jgi:membrane protein implicated in regulation of membrane protease activity
VTIGIVYVGLLVMGVTYAFVSGAFGWFSDLGVGDGIHVDASGHLDAGHAHPISGTTIATFITGFGAGGVVAHYLLRWTGLASLGTATLSGLVLALAAYLVLELIFSQTQAGAEHDTGEAVGRDAEVVTPIPAGGTGEVAYLARGQRELASARTSDGTAVPRGRPVVIERVVGQTLYVRPRE